MSLQDAYSREEVGLAKSVMDKIVARWVKGECVAELSHHPEVKSSGKSVEEAVGNLISSYPDHFGLTVEVVWAGGDKGGSA